MKIIVRDLNGNKIAEKEFDSDAIMVHKSVIEELVGVKDLGELKAIEVKKEFGLIRYQTNKFIIEVWM